MAGVVYLGDPVTASGFRLAGADVHAAEAGREAEQVRELAAGAALLLVSASVAAALPAALLERRRTAVQPLFLVLPDLATGALPDDRLARVLGQLGVEP